MRIDLNPSERRLIREALDCLMRDYLSRIDWSANDAVENEASVLKEFHRLVVKIPAEIRPLKP